MKIELKMTVSGYSCQRVWLHWMSAVVIVWTLVSGFYVAGMDVSAQTAEKVAFINVSLTTVFIPFFFWRLCMFAAHSRDQHASPMMFGEKLAFFAHSLIYLTVSVVLLTGVLMMNRPIDVFAIFQIAQPLSDPALIAQFVTVHVWACVILSGLIALHIGAVIVHEARGQRILLRMSLRRCGQRPIERFE
jgi:cytochrome b561